MTLQAAEERDVTADIGELVDALTVAWNTHLLYADPIPQVPFQRALDTIRRLKLPLHLEVGAGRFCWDGEVVDTGREGAQRLATRMFLHDVGRLRILSPPHPSDLVQLFGLLNADEEDVLAAGGLGHVLAGEGIEALKVDQRTLAAGRAADSFGDFDDPARDPRIVELLEEIVSPEELAARVDGIEPEAAERFIAWFGEACSLLESDDVGGREQVVGMFVEAFFHLDADTQASAIELLLEAADDPWVRVFLDQFSGHDLLTMASRLNEGHMQLLIDYARISTDEADTRPDELMGLLQSAGDVKVAHRVVVDRIQALLGPEAARHDAEVDTLASLRAAAPSPATFFATGLGVLRDLVAVEDREPRLRRILRIWVGKVAAGIRRSELDVAGAWYRSLVEDPPYPANMQPIVDDVLGVLQRPELIAAISTALADPQRRQAALRFLEYWGPEAVPGLVDALGGESDQARRRRLIDLVLEVARIDPRPLVAAPTDEPWYLARNVATILGHCRHPEAAARLRSFAMHHEPRVRVEAVRALASFLSGQSGGENRCSVLACLEDPDARVRRAALIAVGSCDAPEVDASLIAMLHRVDSFEEKSRVLAMLAERGSPAARKEITRVASRRFLISGEKRALRAAARHMLWMSA